MFFFSMTLVLKADFVFVSQSIVHQQDICVHPNLIMHCIEF